MLDVSDVSAFTVRAVSAFDNAPREVLSLVEQGAEELRNTDHYQDRTGDLRRSTQAINVNDDPDAWEFHLEMGEHYASYVQDKGFSSFDEMGQVVAENVGVYLLDLGGALSG